MIFISYSWKYKEKAQNIVKTLRQNGEDVWVDDERLDLTQPLEEQIEKGIKECNRFLQLYSDNIPRTAWMCFEYKIALNCFKRIELIELESCISKPI